LPNHDIQHNVCSANYGIVRSHYSVNHADAGVACRLYSDQAGPSVIKGQPHTGSAQAL